MTARHLAQFNTATLRAPLDAPESAGFRDHLDRLNALADRADGFVWRLAGADGTATGLAADAAGRVLPNLSVWRDLESLQRFVFRTLHRRFLDRRGDWFLPQQGAYMVMWPVAPGHRPGLAEGAARLSRLRAAGDTPEAFGWAWARRHGWQGQTDGAVT